VRASFRPLRVWLLDSTPAHQRRSRHTFKAAWSDTLDLLDRELSHLGADVVVIQADFREEDIRLDGMPRSGARAPEHPGVIINFESAHGPLQYATDAHAFWQHNVRGIALGLAALRAVDRYGITKTGEQYTGWKQLTAGSGLTSREEAVVLLGRLTEQSPETVEVATGNGQLRSVYRQALKKAHPDLGGSTELLSSVRDAGRILGLADL